MSFTYNQLKQAYEVRAENAGAVFLPGYAFPFELEDLSDIEEILKSEGLEGCTFYDPDSYDDERELADAVLDEFCEVFNVGDDVAFYIDEKLLLRDRKTEMTVISIGQFEFYCF